MFHRHTRAEEKQHLMEKRRNHIFAHGKKTKDTLYFSHQRKSIKNIQLLIKWKVTNFSKDQKISFYSFFFSRKQLSLSIIHLSLSEQRSVPKSTPSLIKFLTFYVSSNYASETQIQQNALQVDTGYHFNTLTTDCSNLSDLAEFIKCSLALNTVAVSQSLDGFIDSSVSRRTAGCRRSCNYLCRCRCCCFAVLRK